MIRARHRFTAVVLAALAGTAASAPLRPAIAQTAPPAQPANPADLPRRQANFAWEGTLLRASFAYGDVLDRAITEKLSSGLPTVIAMRAYVIEDGKTEPAALAVRTCRVTYDLWEEVYRVVITGPGGETNRAVINVDGVVRLCAEARDLPIVDRSHLKKGTRYFLGVIVDVNPISPAMIQQIRQWVSRPTGSTSLGPGDALFGSFVGLFVRQIGTSDRTLRFRTQSLVP